MATETFSISSGAFGFIMGSITLLGIIVNIVRLQLPSNKIKVLESLLDETETFFRKAIEDGLLMDARFVRASERRLGVLKQRTHGLQCLAYSATTLSQDCAELFKGTTRSIGRACRSIKKLRADVISISAEGRRRLNEMNAARRSAFQYLPINTVTRSENRPTLPPTVEIIRPRSWPPSLAGCSDDTQSVTTTQNNPFSDATQSGSDVQTTDTQNSMSVEYTSVNLELEA